MKTALVAGSTGLIGQYVLQLLLASNRYDKVKAVVRSELHLSHPKLVQIRINYADLEKHKEELKADDVFCCLGTTMAKARSKEKFREVDFTFPLSLAKATLEQEATQFLIVSALGADKDSSIFYNKVKGELEEELIKFNFRVVHIFRPSLLLGPRGEKRAGEDAAKVVYKVFGFLLPDKYKAIHGEKVAKAMLHFASLEQKGVFIHESREMQHF
jgi:uncharacterized protein YbjT (DUF2867 family)